jgi:hypothetical protein
MLKSDKIMNIFLMIKMIRLLKYAIRPHINDHINIDFFQLFKISTVSINKSNIILLTKIVS